MAEAAHAPLCVVDAHHHLWDLSRPYPWLNGPNRVEVHVAGPLDPIRHTYLLDDYLGEGKQVKVVKSVHVQAEAEEHVAEAEWLQSIADKRGYPHGIVSGIRLHESEATVSSVLAKLSGMRNVRGVRQLLNYSATNASLCLTDRDHLADAAFARGYALLARHALSFDLHCLPQQASQAVTVLERHSTTPVIVDHCGLDPYRTPDSFRAWRHAIRSYATMSHASMKISGLGMFDHAWTVDSIRPYVLACIEEFGVHRCFFASNFPVDKLLSSYDHLFLAFSEIVAHLPAEQQHALFQTNAERVYRI